MSSTRVINREVGPDTLTTAINVLLRSLTGALTEVRPISISSLATAYPCRRSLDPGQEFVDVLRRGQRRDGSTERLCGECFDELIVAVEQQCATRRRAMHG